MNRLRTLTEQGQAIWLDYIRRDLLENGRLARLISEDGLTGVTSNPAIFEKAIGDSDLYDGDIRAALEEDPEISTQQLYEKLAIRDIQMAADLLAPVYEATDGADGFVSLEVSPHLAHDTEGTLLEARHLWRTVDRPNLMIKVPATREGIPAVESLLAEGVHVNITLMFSLAHYEAVAQAYLRGVERASKPQRSASVASFFVSRVDTLIDRRLAESAAAQAHELAGRIAIANSKMAYARYREIFHGSAFARLKAEGARPQRVLWASTSTKNPDYSDVLYVEELIGAETVNTIPPKTLDDFRDRGEVAPTLTAGLDRAQADLSALAAIGIDLDAATDRLQREGLEKFGVPFDRLLAALDRKRVDLAAAPLGAAAAGRTK
ncbi:MAG: transaldolase [Acidobacteria bacterium]|nr:transaldolase [Acidobacteriota bacterium]